MKDFLEILLGILIMPFLLIASAIYVTVWFLFWCIAEPFNLLFGKRKPRGG